MKRILCILLCLVFCACVPTPENEIVFGDAQVVSTNDTLESLTVPDAVQEVVLEQEQTRVIIDASVTVRATAPYADIAYEKAAFSDRELNAFLAVLIGDSPVYSVPERTKDVIKAEMEACVQTMEQLDPSSDDYSAAKEELRNLQKEFQDAPDSTLNPDPIDRKMQSVEGSRFFQAIAPYQGHTFSLFANKSMMYLQDFSRAYPIYASLLETVPASSLSQAQAEETAKALVLELAPHLALWKTEHRWNESATADAYEMIFRPAVNGAAAADRKILNRDDSILFAEIWHADCLTVEIDSEGIVQVAWTNPGKASELPQTNVGLVPFDQVLSNAKQQLKNMYAWQPEGVEQTVEREIYVDRIVLEYAVVMWRDHGDVYRLIPVWNFYGGERFFDPMLGTVEQYGIRTDIVHVSINAMTGKVLPN